MDTGDAAEERGSHAEHDAAHEARGNHTEDDGLGRRRRDILALERRGFTAPGVKERVIREELGLAPVRYYQLLNALLDDPRALAHDPVTVNRLRRVRESRRRER